MILISDLYFLLNIKIQLYSKNQMISIKNAITLKKKINKLK